MTQEGFLSSSGMEMTRFGYENYQFIGKGTFGEVYSARRSDGERIAMKCARIVPSALILDGEEKVPFEIYALKRLRDVPGVVNMLDYYVDERHYCIVMEYASSDLYDVMRTVGHFDERLCKKIFRDILETVISCKDRGFVHNDIKLENIAFDLRTETVKILDFGLSELYVPGYRWQFKGTLEFAPPEYNDYGIHDGESTTVWTLGLLLYEISQGRFPELHKRPLSFVVRISLPMQNFIRRCLGLYLRPSLTELLNLEWLKK